MTDRALPDVVTVGYLTRGRVFADGELRHLCPHRDEVDNGGVTVSWTCADGTLELHSLAAYFATWSDTKVSHEDITATIRRDLETLPGILDVKVATRWETAGFIVTVE